MISSKSKCSFQLFNQFVRSISSKSLSTLKVTNKIPKKIKEIPLAKKKIKKLSKKRLTLEKTEIDNESYWLDSLNAENLKLYRKTSFGSFRVIHTDKLIDKLKIIYPELRENAQLKLEGSGSPEPPSLNPPVNPKDSNLQMCQFLLENMLTFPLFNDTNENLLKTLNKEDETVNSSKFPSVTKILNRTMPDSSKEKLVQWEAKMVQELGAEKFMDYKKNNLNTGFKLHGCLKQYLQTKDESQVSIEPAIEGCWNSVKHLLADISEVKMLEKTVCHPVLMYKGVVDCIASYRDVPCIIEWKRSDKKKLSLSSTFDAPLQLCAYLGAVCWQKKIPNLRNGLVVVVYTDGTPATVLPMDVTECEHYWGVWLQRLQSYWGSNNADLMQSESKM